MFVAYDVCRIMTFVANYDVCRLYCLSQYLQISRVELSSFLLFLGIRGASSKTIKTGLNCWQDEVGRITKKDKYSTAY